MSERKRVYDGSGARRSVSGPEPAPEAAAPNRAPGTITPLSSVPAAEAAARLGHRFGQLPVYGAGSAGSGDPVRAAQEAGAAAASPLQAKMGGGNGGAQNGGERDDERPVLPETVGIGGAQGRERLVRAQEARAHAAGQNAPQVDFDATLHRNTPSRFWQGFADHRFSEGGMRYNEVGTRMLYASPSLAENLGEMQAYARAGHHPMADRTRVEFNFEAHPDPATGRGGVADVSGNLGDLGLTRGALTAEKGGNTDRYRSSFLDQTRPGRWLNDVVEGQVARYGPRPLHLLTGESPYLHSRALGSGAQDAGASALRAPSATGGDQVDIFARNTQPSQLRYQRHVPYDAAGNPQAPVVDPAAARPMPAATDPLPAGVSVEPAPTRRASGARYGAIGAGVMAGFNNFRDGEVSAGDVAGVAGHTALGAGSGLATDALERGIANRAGQRLGQGAVGRAVPGAAAGGLVSAVTSGAFSTWDNADAYRNGQVSAGQATANVAVDTGVGLGAGLAGAAAGAAVGSVIPVAGTAVGALVGFGAGMLGSYLASEAAHRSGFTGWAKNRLGGALANYEKPLGRAWNGISQTTHAIGDGVSNAGHAVANGAGRLWTGAKNTAGNAYHAVAGTAGRAIHNVADAAHSVSGAAHRAWDGVSRTAGRALGGARRAAGAVADTAGRAVHNVAGTVAGGARRVASGVSNVAHRAWDGARHAAGSASRAITSTASAAVSGAGRVINNVASSAGSAVQHVASGAGHAVANVASGVSNTAGRAWNAVSDWWNGK